MKLVHLLWQSSFSWWEVCSSFLLSILRYGDFQLYFILFYAYYQFWKLLFCTSYKFLFPIICFKCNVVLAELRFWKSILGICFDTVTIALRFFYCDFVIFFLFCAWQTFLLNSAGLYLHFATSVIHEITTALGIYCFRWEYQLQL